MSARPLARGGPASPHTVARGHASRYRRPAQLAQGTALALQTFAMRVIALLTLLAFGCAAARPPQPIVVSEMAVPPPRVALAEPELELWMEGTHPVDPQESARALEQSRDALSVALEGRGLDDVQEPEQLVVVRAREIARTDERKTAQTWSYVGIVVVVVGIVIAAVLLSKSSSSRGSKAGRVATPAAPRFGPVRPGPRFVPRPYVPPPPIGVSIGLNVVVPVGPVAPIPYAAAGDPLLGSRGWFDGDAVELTVELVDATTGAVSWSRTVREGTDPRDANAVSRLLDRALWGMPFGQRQGPLRIPTAAPASASRDAAGEVRAPPAG